MTSFKRKVYRIVSNIPAGKVLTYSRVAGLAGSCRAARAVGKIMAKNTKGFKIPCHRVVKSNGEVGKWSGKGGRNKKISLLRKEGHIIKDGKIVLTRPLTYAD